MLFSFWVNCISPFMFGFREFLRQIWTVMCQLTVRNTVDTCYNQHETCQITASCEVLELFKEITLINHKHQLTIV